MLSSRNDRGFEMHSSFQQFFLQTDGHPIQRLDLCEKRQRSAALLQDHSAEMQRALLQLLCKSRGQLTKRRPRSTCAESSSRAQSTCAESENFIPGSGAHGIDEQIDVYTCIGILSWMHCLQECVFICNWIKKRREVLYFFLQEENKKKGQLAFSQAGQILELAEVSPYICPGINFFFQTKSHQIVTRP